MNRRNVRTSFLVVVGFGCWLGCHDQHGSTNVSEHGQSVQNKPMENDSLNVNGNNDGCDLTTCKSKCKPGAFAVCENAVCTCRTINDIHRFDNDPGTCDPTDCGNCGGTCNKVTGICEGCKK
jgi:hypothetical protein